MKAKANVLLILLFILVGSSFLRLYKIDDKPVWYDETTSISLAERPLSFYISSPQATYKPVYFFLLNRWLYLFGESIFYLRFFSLIWGVVNIFLVYKLTRLIFNAETGLISAFLLGISIFHIFQCQQVRQFSFIAFLATASIYYFFKFYKKGKVFDLGCLLIVNILLINTYPTGFLVVLVEGIFATLCLRGRLLSKWIIYNLPLVLFMVLWFFVSDRRYIKEMAWWISKPGLASIAETLNTFSWGGPRYGMADFKISLSWPWLMWLLSIGYFILVLFGFTSCKSKMRSAGLLLFLWLVVPVLISYIYSWLNDFSVYAIKHLIIVLPAFCIIVARGVFSLKPKGRGAVILLICLLNFLPLSVMYDNYFFSDWKNSTRYVNEAIKKGDVVIISSLGEVITFMFYFEKKKYTLKDVYIYGKITQENYKNNVFMAGNNNLIIGIKESGFGDRAISAESDFKEKVMRNTFIKQRRVWVMISRWTSPEARSLIINYFKDNFLKIECRDFQGVSVCCFDPLRLPNK